jgi:hypothetical protein
LFVITENTPFLEQEAKNDSCHKPVNKDIHLFPPLYRRFAIIIPPIKKPATEIKPLTAS